MILSELTKKEIAEDLKSGDDSGLADRLDDLKGSYAVLYILEEMIVQGIQVKSMRSRLRKILETSFLER